MKPYLSLIASLFIVSTPIVLPATASETKIIAQEINPYIKDNIAREITVKISSEDSGGSGVIIAQQDNTYLVLTNNHVLRDREEFTVYTYDGETYQATEVEKAISTGDDLALLQFESDKSYQTATINTAAIPKAEQAILAVGYSAETGELVTETGTIEQVPDKTLKEGYSIGYSSNIVQGMSGGAIFNTDGEVIGINGKSSFPIINTGYDREDGTKPSAEEIEQYRQLSWGLSINRLLTQINPEIITAYNLPLPETKDTIETPELIGWLGELEAKAKQISVRIDSSSGANGSGVIIAKEGNTYTVLTADHVLCEKDDDRKCIDYTYEILAPDGKKYPINIETVKRQEGVDLAVVRFDSDELYEIAELANYPIALSDAVFAAGYPKLNNNTPAQWLFSFGFGMDREQGLLQVNDNSLSVDGSGLTSSKGSLSGGYEMVYSNITYGGMSGGAVLDLDGRVIGIHGLSEGETILNSQNSSGKKIQIGFSLGIPINTLMKLADKFEINASLPIQDNRHRELNSAELRAFARAILDTEVPQENASAETWLERGNQLWRLRLTSQAIQAFDRAIALNPKFVHLAYYGKGLALIDKKEYEAALVSLERATKTKSDFALSFFYKSGILQVLNRPNKALIAIERAIFLQDNNANLHSHKGQILLKLKRYSEAEVAFQKAIVINPRATFYNNLGILHKEQGKIKSALTYYNQAIEINPTDANAYYNKGLLHYKQGKIDLAFTNFERTIELSPNRAEGYIGRGVCYAEQGKMDLALADYTKAIQPSAFLRQNQDSSGAYSNRGRLYEQQGKIELALADYNQATKLNHNNVRAYFNRGSLYQKQGKTQLAITDYSQVIRLDRKHSEAYINRGTLYFSQGKRKLALADFEQAITANPINPDIYAALGNISVQMGDIKRAKTNFEMSKALYIAQGDTTSAKNIANLLQQYTDQEKSELPQANSNQNTQTNSEESEAYNDDAITYHEQGKYDLAEEYYTKAIEIDPQSAKAYSNRGSLYDEQGKWKLALSDYSKAIEINPQFAEAYVNRGISYKIRGEMELALSDYSKAIEISPQLAEAYLFRGNIYDIKKEFELALSDYSKAIKISPQLKSAYGNRGLLHKRRGELELALSDFNRVIELDSSDAKAYSQIGDLQWKLGNTVAAQTNLQKARKLYFIQGNTVAVEQIEILLEIYTDREKAELVQANSNQDIQADSKDALAYFKQGNIYHQQKKYELAEENYTKSIQLNPNYIDAYVLRGSVYLTQEKYELAEADYTKSIQLDPANKEAYSFRGNVYAAQGKYKLAEVDYTKSIQLDPNDAEIYLLRSGIYLKQEEYKLAEADLTKSIQLDPNDADIYNIRGSIYFIQKEYKLARTDLEKSKELFVAKGDLEKAAKIDDLLQQLTKLEQSVPTSDRTPQSAGEYYDRTSENHQKREYDLALANHNKAIQQSHNNIEAYYNRGDFYYEQGELERAISDFDKVIQLDSNHTEAYTNLGFVYRQTGNVEEAEFNLQKAQQLLIAQGKTEEAENLASLLQEYAKEQRSEAVDRNPQSADEYYDRAFEYHQKQEYDLALADYNQVIELDPSNEKALINRGLIYQSQGKDEDAIADYNKAIQINPNNFATYRNRGVLYFEQSQYELAKADWDKAIAINPKDALAYYNRGLLYLKLSDSSSAKTDLEKAEELAVVQENTDLAEKAADALQKLP